MNISCRAAAASSHLNMYSVVLHVFHPLSVALPSRSHAPAHAQQPQLYVTLSSLLTTYIHI